MSTVMFFMNDWVESNNWSMIDRNSIIKGIIILIILIINLFDILS
jgi:hypothetical protein